MEATKYSNITLHVDKDEKQGLSEMADFYGCSIPDLIKAITDEWFEDRYDIQVFKNFEKNKETEMSNAISFEQLKKDVGYV